MGTYLTLKRLGKADCGERMTQAESRKVQLDMLDSLLVQRLQDLYM